MDVQVTPTAITITPPNDGRPVIVESSDSAIVTVLAWGSGVTTPEHKHFWKKWLKRWGRK